MPQVCIVTVWADGSIGYHHCPDEPTAQKLIADTPVLQDGTSYIIPLDTTTVPGIVRKATSVTTMTN
jgi:hypothetical protein